MLTEKTFDTGEILINYVEGAPSGPPMVMLHGATVWWKDLQPLIGQLESSWHIYVCDHRGHGKSGRAAGHYRIADYARDTAAFLKHVVKNPAVVIGHSLGGMVGLKVAAQLPQQVAGLVLLDPPLELRELRVAQAPYYNWFSWVYETVRSSSSVSEVADKCQVFMPELDANAAGEMAEMLYRVDPECPATIMSDAIFADFGWTDTMQRITCPTLLLWGEKLDNDASAVRPADVEFLLAHVARSTAVQIKGTGHGGHRDKTGEVLGHIAVFLGTVDQT